MFRRLGARKKTAAALVVALILASALALGYSLTSIPPQLAPGLRTTPGQLPPTITVTQTLPAPVPAPAPAAPPPPLEVGEATLDVGGQPFKPVTALALIDVLGRKIVYSANLALEVEDVEASLADVQAVAESLGGLVAHMATSKRGDVLQGSITIRVPQAEFFTALQQIEALGEVRGKEVRSQDVTETFVDLEARLRNAQEEERRLLELLGRAGSVGDLLQVERELARVRAEIERLTGQLQLLERRVELSTISVSLFEVGAPEPEQPNPLLEAVKLGIAALMVLAQGLIVLAIVGGPLAAVGGSVLYAFRRRKARLAS